MISGQLFFRETGQVAPNNPNNKLMMVTGIISVSKDTKIKGEHQYVIDGEEDNYVALTVYVNEGKDLTELVRGLTLGQLTLKSIWRC